MPEEVRVSIDPHVHSEGSYDGKEPVDLILEHAADIGLDAVAITDHDEIEKSLEAADMAEDYGLIGVPGVEVSTKAGHLLALGVEKKPEKKKPLKETIERVRELGGAAVIPHPFQRTRHGVKKRRINKPWPDALEIYNSWLFTGYRNRRAKKFARKREIPGVAASDSHSVATVGRAYTEIVFEEKGSLDEIDSADVVKAIRDGRTDIQGRRVPVYKSAYHYLKGTARKGAYTVRKVSGFGRGFTGKL